MPLEMIYAERRGYGQLACALDIRGGAKGGDVERHFATQVDANAAGRVPHTERVSRAATRFEAAEPALDTPVERAAAEAMPGVGRRRPVVRPVSDAAAIVHRQFHPRVRGGNRRAFDEGVIGRLEIAEPE